jgi:hypothetical protein
MSVLETRDAPMRCPSVRDPGFRSHQAIEFLPDRGPLSHRPAVESESPDRCRGPGASGCKPQGGKRTATPPATQRSGPRRVIQHGAEDGEREERQVRLSQQLLDSEGICGDSRARREWRPCRPVASILRGKHRPNLRAGDVSPACSSGDFGGVTFTSWLVAPNQSQRKGAADQMIRRTTSISTTSSAKASVSVR